MDVRQLTGTPWVEAEYPDNTTHFFPGDTSQIPTDAAMQAFYDYHANRPNPLVDNVVQDLQGTSGRSYPPTAPKTPGPGLSLFGRGMAATPPQRSQGASGRVMADPYERVGRFTGAASNMGSTDMRANYDVMSLRENDPISDILMRGGMPPAAR